MPVGRVSFQHVEPMGFPEFLEAHGQQRLLRPLSEWTPGPTPLPEAAHERATEWLHRYSMVGGMPAVVAADAGGRDARACRELQRDLLAAFRADFAKYSGRMHPSVLDATLRAVAGSLGRKLVYAHFGDGVKQHQARRALDLLTSAGVCHLVRHSAANGLPLGAESKDTFRKAILVDVGLAHALLGTPAATTFPSWTDLAPAVRGQLADQLAGQQLRLVDALTGDGPQLFYWQREGGRPGEGDYLVVVEGRIVPIELKSGAAGSMKSLHQFMFDKHLDLAVRCDANPPSVMDVSVKTTRGDPVSYRLLSLPPYLRAVGPRRGGGGGHGIPPHSLSAHFHTPHVLNRKNHSVWLPKNQLDIVLLQVYINVLRDASNAGSRRGLARRTKDLHRARRVGFHRPRNRQRLAPSQ